MLERGFFQNSFFSMKVKHLIDLSRAALRKFGTILQLWYNQRRK